MSTPTTTPQMPGPDDLLPHDQPPQRPASTFSLVLVALALVGGAAGTFMFLSAHPVAREASVATTPSPEGSSLPPAHDVKSPAAGAAHWSRENEYRWIANHHRSVAYEVAASQQVKVWTTHVRPTLVLRCLNRKTEVFVYTETPAKLESGDGMHTVRLTFDGGTEAEERWPDSAEHDALFSPDGTSLARRLSSAHHLRFGFSPHNADPVQVDFDLDGSDSVVSHVSKTCGWK
jgi:hypothetical protein